MNTIESLFGVNWRTTISGMGAALLWLLTLLAGLPAELGAAFALFPAEWKGRIAISSAISAAILQSIHAAFGKDAKVTGNGTVYEPAKVAESDGSNRTIAPLFFR